MRRLFPAVIIVWIFFAASMSHAQQFKVPDNYLPAREMIIDRDHAATEIEADRSLYRYFFRPEAGVKKAPSPVVAPSLDKGWTKEQKSVLGIVKDILRPENIFDYYPLTDQLNTPERLATAFSLGYLLDNDRSIYTEWDRRMKQSDFWQKNGNSITFMGNGVSEVAIAGLLYVKGSEKDRKVAHMLLESALSLRVQYAKRMLGVTRPSDTVASIWPSMTYDAFPSGHTWTAFSLATILGEAYDIKWLTYPLALLTGISRIQQNTHWPSDVLAGGILGHLEARHLMAKHGFIPSSQISESAFWKNTRVDISGDYSLYYDSNERLNDNDPLTDRVGRLTWRWEASQHLSPDALVQVDYHWRGQIPQIVSYNSVEDVLTSPRLAYRLGKSTIFFAQYTDNRIKFKDLGTSPHEPQRAMPPPNLYYVGELGEKRSTTGFFFRLSPDFYLKPSYSVSDNVVQDFPDLYSRGGKARIELATSGERDAKTDAYFSFSDGWESARGAQYSQKNREYHLSLTQHLGKNHRLSFTYMGESRLYPDALGTSRSAKSFWQVSGLEYRRDFSDTWNAQVGVYRRSLSSDIPGWGYRKNLYMLQLNKSF
jgi:hypothetical protein